MHFSNVLFFFLSMHYIEALDINLKYCQFECGKTCKEGTSTTFGLRQPKLQISWDIAKKPKASYYWRDFYGVIPPDAYPIGSPKQFPQTYVGLAYDPSKNGTFSTTIFDGLDYVYTAFGGTTRKIIENIQILCSPSPEDLKWFDLSTMSYNELSSQGYRLVQAYWNEIYINGSVKRNWQDVVGTNHCDIMYAGVTDINGVEMEFSLIDGTNQITPTFKTLMYINTTSPRIKRQINIKPEVPIQPSSPLSQPDVPNGNISLMIGSCTVTCSNTCQNCSEENKAMKVSSSLAYYWQSNKLVYEDEALPAGSDKKNKVLYVGQAAVFYHNFNDVGPSNLKSVTINDYNQKKELSTDFHVLSSNQPEKFKWVETTTKDFPQIKKDILIPGGAYSNGTKTYVCRFKDPGKNKFMYPGSARLLPDGTYCFTLSGPKTKFEILTYVGGQFEIL